MSTQLIAVHNSAYVERPDTTTLCRVKGHARVHLWRKVVSNSVQLKVVLNNTREGGWEGGKEESRGSTTRSRVVRFC